MSRSCKVPSLSAWMPERSGATTSSRSSRKFAIRQSSALSYVPRDIPRGSCSADPERSRWVGKTGSDRQSSACVYVATSSSSFTSTAFGTAATHS